MMVVLRLQEQQVVVSKEHALILGAWLKDLSILYFNTGGSLVQSLACADNVRLAEKMLDFLENNGVIERGKNPSPTKEMAFFGLGGSTGYRTSSVAFGFSPKDTAKLRAFRAQISDATQNESVCA